MLLKYFLATPPPEKIGAYAYACNIWTPAHDVAGETDGRTV